MRHQYRAFIFSRIVLCVAIVGLSASCARLPYTTKVVHEDARVVVVLQQEVDAAALFASGAADTGGVDGHLAGVLLQAQAAHAAALVC